MFIQGTNGASSDPWAMLLRIGLQPLERQEVQDLRESWKKLARTSPPGCSSGRSTGWLIRWETIQMICRTGPNWSWNILWVCSREIPLMYFFDILYAPSCGCHRWRKIQLVWRESCASPSRELNQPLAWHTCSLPLSSGAQNGFFEVFIFHIVLIVSSSWSAPQPAVFLLNYWRAPLLSQWTASPMQQGNYPVTIVQSSGPASHDHALNQNIRAWLALHCNVHILDW